MLNSEIQNWRVEKMKFSLVKNLKGRLANEAGAVLLSAIGVFAIVLALSAGVYTIWDYQNQTTTHNKNTQSALQLAEAGANEAIFKLKADWDANPVGTTFADDNIGNGNFQVEIVDSPTGETNKKLIKSVGEVNGVSKEVQVLVVQRAPKAFDYAYFADVRMHLDNHELSNVVVKTLKAHSNGTLNFDEGINLIGDISAVTRITIGSSRSQYGPDTEAATIQGNATAPEVWISSKGLLASRQAGSINGESYPPANGDVRAGMLVTDAIITNEGKNYSGGNVQPDGYSSGANASSGIQGTFTLDSSVVVEPITWPQFDFDGIEQKALNGDAGYYYFNTNSEFLNYLNSNGKNITGTFYVNDNILIANPITDSTVTVNGTLVSAGTITIHSRYEQYGQTSSEPGIMAAKGDIKIDAKISDYNRGPVFIKGVLYAVGIVDKGEIHLHQNDPSIQVTIQGSEVAKTVHNCEAMSFTYNPIVQLAEGFFTPNTDKPEVLIEYWREL